MEGDTSSLSIKPKDLEYVATDLLSAVQPHRTTAALPALSIARPQVNISPNESRVNTRLEASAGENEQCNVQEGNLPFHIPQYHEFTIWLKDTVMNYLEDSHRLCSVCQAVNVVQYLYDISYSGTLELGYFQGILMK